MSRKTLASPLIVPLLALGLALGGSLAARAADAVLDQRIDINLEKGDASDVFRSFAQVASLAADLDPGLAGTLSLRLVNVRLETAMNAACESLGCRWEMRDGKLIVKPLPAVTDRPAAEASSPGNPIDGHIDLKVTNASAQDLLKTFGEITSARPDIDPAITGRGTFNLVDIPVGKALDQVCARFNCTWSLSGGGLKVSAKR